MPPKDKLSYDNFDLYFEDGRLITPIQTIDVSEEEIDEYNPRFDLVGDTLTIYCGCRARKKMSRASKMWRILRLVGIDYRAGRRVIRQAERARREALKRRAADGTTADMG